MGERATGWVAVVGGGPGDPGLITRRGWELLQQADLVLTDHLAPLTLLDELAELGRHPQVIDAAKYPGGRAMPQEEINEHLVAGALAGKNVVRLKGGDPNVFGRGIEEAWACAEAGVAVQVVPGVSSAVAVSAWSGLPLTFKDLSQAFTVVSGHVPPAHPDSLVDWGALARSGATLVVLMGVRTMPAIAAALLKAGMPADTPTLTVGEGGTALQYARACALEQLLERSVEVRPPAVTIIGAVVGLRR